MLIRAAAMEEWEKVVSLYNSMIDGMQNEKYKPGWKKGIYPDEKFVQEAIEKQELYVGISDGAFVGAMVVNHEAAGAYESVEWKAAANPGEVAVIHALGIVPERQRQGLAGEMVRDVIARARENGQKAVRLDVLAGNVSAQKFYLALGFEYRGTVQIYYEDTGLTEFLLYEYVL